MIRKLLGLLFVLFLFYACKESSEVARYSANIHGETMGTFYNITIPNNKNVAKGEVDSILHLFNLELSTYIDTSFISQINDPLINAKVIDPNKHKWFIEITEKSQEIYKLSDGDFDPTVNPLVQYWGFGNLKKPREAKQSEIDSMMSFVSFEKLDLSRKKDQYFLSKADRRISLDYSAIAKGYGVDVIAEYLEDEKNIKDYLIEIGGECKMLGKNSRGLNWSLGINRPKKESSLKDMILKVNLESGALASSGNYRNYYTIDGKTYAHTINPKTGLSKASDLLAVTVISKECWFADAVATACMVKGLEESKTWINELADTEACFFFEEGDGISYSLSRNFDSYIIN